MDVWDHLFFLYFLYVFNFVDSSAKFLYDIKAQTKVYLGPFWLD